MNLNLNRQKLGDSPNLAVGVNVKDLSGYLNLLTRNEQL